MKRLPVWAVGALLLLLAVRGAAAAEYEDFKAVLSDAQGHSYPGTIRIWTYFEYGTMDFPGTPLGHVEGRFAFVPGTLSDSRQHVQRNMNWHEPFKMPLLDMHHGRDWDIYGRAYLNVGKRLVIRCHLGAALDREKALTGTSWSNMYTLESPEILGACADRNGGKWTVKVGDWN